MPARDPNYQPTALVFPCAYCGEPLPPGRAGLHDACVIAKTEAGVATRCKRCGTTDRIENGDCKSYFHAKNRETRR